jgi:hypothetical protein
MKKVAINDKVEIMQNESYQILEKIFIDSIIEIYTKGYICEDILGRIVLVYLSFFSSKKYINLKDLTKYELNLIFKMISKGIILLNVEEKYLTFNNKDKKKEILEDILTFLVLLTDQEYEVIKVKIWKEMKVYLERKKFKEII